MAKFGVGRGSARDKDAVPGPEVVAPRRSLDGWTLDGTDLDGRFPREELRELATLLHGVATGQQTPWIYERAAELLEEHGERPQALAVLDAWFTQPQAVQAENAGATRALGRRRQRLRVRMGIAPSGAASAAAGAASTAKKIARRLTPTVPQSRQGAQSTQNVQNTQGVQDVPPPPVVPPVVPPKPPAPPQTVEQAERSEKAEKAEKVEADKAD